MPERVRAVGTALRERRAHLRIAGARRVATGTLRLALATLLVVHAALAPVAGCSLQGLDRLPFTRCNDDRGCLELNIAAGIDERACVGWECRANFCRLVERDSDRDHHVSAFCPGGDDCDDHDPSVSPEVAEVCDGRDQDCDHAIDEELADAFVLDPPSAIPILPLAEAPRGLRVDVEELGASVTFLDSTNAVRFERVESHAALSLSPALTLSVAATSTATPVSGCARPLAAPIPPEPTCVGASDCGAGETCTARADGLRVCGSGTATCATDVECGDGVTCNGAERCVPGGPTSDARGCAPPSPTRACAAGETCDEASRECRSATLLGICTLAEVAVAPVGDDTYVVAAISRDCPAGGVRIAHFLAAATDRSLLAVGGGGRSTSWDGIDTTPGGCTGATRASGVVGARGPAIAALAGDGSRTPQALAAYLAAPRGDTTAALVEIVGVWLERGAADVLWTHATGSGVPSVLPLRATAGTTRPAVVAVERGAESVFAVAYAADGGGVAVHVVRALGEPGILCPPSPLEPCIVDGVGGPVTVIPPASLDRERTSAPLEAPVSATIAGSAVEGDVSLAVGPPAPGATEPEVAVAYVEAGEVVVAIGTIDVEALTITFPADRTHRVAADGARDLSVARVGAGLTDPDDDRRRGGYVLTWTAPLATLAMRVSDEEPTRHIVSRLYDDVADAPRAVLLAEGLAVVAHTNGGIVVFPFACGRPVP